MFFPFFRLFGGYSLRNYKGHFVGALGYAMSVSLTTGQVQHEYNYTLEKGHFVLMCQGDMNINLNHWFELI